METAFQIAVVMGVLVIWFVLSMFMAQRIVKAGPNQVLVISGRKRWIRRADGTNFLVGFRMLKGGRTFVWPILERVDRLSLEPFNVDLSVISVQTLDRQRINLDGVASVKFGSDEYSIAQAAQHFLSKTAEKLNSFVQEYVEAKLRNIVGMMPSDEVYANRNTVVSRLKSSIEPEFSEMGLILASVSISEINESTSEDMEKFITD